MSNGDEVRQSIVDFIARYEMEHCYAPSIREIGEGVGLSSTSSVYAHLSRLRQENRVESDNDFSPRSIRIPGYKVVKITEE